MAGQGTRISNNTPNAPSRSDTSNSTGFWREYLKAYHTQRGDADGGDSSACEKVHNTFVASQRWEVNFHG